MRCTLTIHGLIVLTLPPRYQRGFKRNDSHSAAAGSIGSHRLLGFSLGGAVAIASARDRRVGAAVIFYGWGLRQLLDRLQSAWQAACLPSRRHRG